ncbi:hypothetical protein [Rhodococcus oryzae]|uniref:hypothetical protein n=1 Tax=Rhodococcus oryzae TaxID=2571143 RepID=UPI0037B11F9D
MSDQQTDEPSRKVAKTEALPIGPPIDRKEVTTSPKTDDHAAPPAELDGHSIALSAFLKFHPFMAFFCWVAHAQFPANHRAETRVAKLREGSKRFYWTCVLLDLVVTFVAVAGLIAIAAAVAYKAVGAEIFEASPP